MEHAGQQPRRLTRRLITLISADRAEPAVIIVIRRELPLTRVAGLSRSSVA